jgi:hypothetical protein
MLLSDWYRRFSILAVIHLVSNWKEGLLKRAEDGKMPLFVLPFLLMGLLTNYTHL